MSEQNITDQTLSPKGDGEAAVSNEGPENLTLEELNAILGKDFPSKEVALKSIKDTYSYVGKKIEPAAPAAPDPTQFVSRAEYNQAQFYASHPEYKPFEAIITKLGTDPEKVVGDESFKKVFESATEYAKIETSKSVLHSNPRLSKVNDNIQEAKEAANKGDYRQAEEKAVSGVIDAFGLR